MASAPARGVNKHKAKLRNVTDSSDVLQGTTEAANIVTDYFSNAANASTTRSYVNGRFTLSGTKALELQHRAETTNTSDGFGESTGFSVTEIFADVLIWKVA